LTLVNTSRRRYLLIRKEILFAQIKRKQLQVQLILGLVKPKIYLHLSSYLSILPSSYSFDVQEMWFKIDQVNSSNYSKMTLGNIDLCTKNFYTASFNVTSINMFLKTNYATIDRLLLILKETFICFIISLSRCL